MNNITMVTENRIKKMLKQEATYSRALDYLLDKLKGWYGYSGATIEECKQWGIMIDNCMQMCVIPDSELRGLCYNFSDYILLTECLDLRYVDIFDFNGLVKVVYEKNCEVWPDLK